MFTDVKKIFLDVFELNQIKLTKNIILSKFKKNLSCFWKVSSGLFYKTFYGSNFCHNPNKLECLSLSLTSNLVKYTGDKAWSQPLELSKGASLR